MSAQNDAAFLRMFLVILGALLAFTAIILIAANQIIGSVEEERGEDPRQRAAIAERIKPVGNVDVADVNAAPAAPNTSVAVVISSCKASADRKSAIGATYDPGCVLLPAFRLAALGGVILPAVR